MAKFSKQDYVSIANVIDATWSKLLNRAYGTDQVWEVKYDMEAVITAFADMFEQDNPNFDRERFVMACNVSQEERS